MKTADELFLYHRKPDYIPRVAAVHDLCGYGKCSLGVAIPVLSAAGIDVCPVPTGLFSSHTNFNPFYMHDTTPMLKGYLDAWDAVGIQLDGIYSGFLGAAEQVESIMRLGKTHPQALRIVDPVMGDAGKMYPTYTAELCQAMKDLVKGADLLTPNLTEASILTGMEYRGEKTDRAHADRICQNLMEMGAKNIILKGLSFYEGKVTNIVAGQTIQTAEVTHERLPYMLHGTGDLFCTTVLAAIMCGESLFDACDFASGFVVDAMKATKHQPDFERRGVSFESVLSEITDLTK